MDLELALMDIDISDETKFASPKNVGVEKHGIVSESCVGTEEEKELVRKRKKECYLPLLDWVKTVASDPCDPAIGSLPGSSKWKAYGSEHFWKQVLLAKKAMRLKPDDHSNAKLPILQKKQKIHPGIYDDRAKKSNTRCSQRLISIEENPSIPLNKKLQLVDSSESSSPASDLEDEDSLWVCNYRNKRIPLGRAFQAVVPEWTGGTQESDTRWLGTRVWPLDETENLTRLIEREPTGNGRHGSCRCQVTGSPGCVRVHIAEQRLHLKLELGPAFVKWKFDTMGEDVSLQWTRSDEKKFRDIIKANPESTGWSFWDILETSFKDKTRPVLVNYYFNVYLVRRRAHQNRIDPSNVDSDDDELEKVGREIDKFTGSIFCCSPKVHLKNAGTV